MRTYNPWRYGTRNDITRRLVQRRLHEVKPHTLPTLESRENTQKRYEAFLRTQEANMKQNEIGSGIPVTGQTRMSLGIVNPD